MDELLGSGRFPNIPEKVSKYGLMVVPPQDQPNERFSINRKKAHKPLLLAENC